MLARTESNVILFPEPATAEEFDLDQLQNVTQRIVKENEFLAEEIAILSDYLRRNEVDSIDASGIVAAVGGARTGLAAHDMLDSMSDVSDMLSVANASSPLSGGTASPITIGAQIFPAGGRQNARPVGPVDMQISMENKLDIVRNGIDELRRTMEREMSAHEQQIADLNAEKEECEEALAIIANNMNTFRKDILMGSTNPRSGKIIAERLNKFFDDMAKKKEEIRRKTDMKEKTMRRQLAKLRQQFNQREEMGETLSKIDFDQLKIENDQMEKTIVEKNDELKRLKMTTGKSQQILAHLQNKLRMKTESVEQLQEAIFQQEQQLEEAKIEIGNTLKEKEHEEKDHARLTRKHEESKVPDVMDYIALKSEVDQLRKDIKSWERKVEVVTGSLRVLRSKVRDIERYHREQQQQQHQRDSRRRHRHGHSSQMSFSHG